MLAVSVPTNAEPNWDWQATYEYDASRNVLSASLDQQSAYWYDCAVPWVQVSTKGSSTTDTRTIERVRLDTSGLFLQKWRQEGQHTSETLCTCAGTRIELPTAGAPEAQQCNITIIGQCQFDCFTSNAAVVRAVIQVGILASIEGSCPKQGGGSVTAICPTGLQTYCTGEKPGATLGSNGNCRITGGLAPIAYCRWN